MRREDAYRLSQNSGLCPDMPLNIPTYPLPEIKHDSLSSMLDAIFCVDERTGFPKGDIQYYMSSDGNPLVKQWIEQNLLQPRVASGQSTPEGVTDDMIAEMSRGANESLSDYQARLTSIYEDAGKQIAPPQSDGSSE